MSVPPETRRRPSPRRASARALAFSMMPSAVDLEFGRGGFAEGDRFGGDDVHVGTAGGAGEDGAIDGPGVVTVGEDEGGARTAQGLVGGGGDDGGVAHGAGVMPGGDEAGDVGHVRHEHGVDALGDLGGAGEVVLARVSGGADDDELGAQLTGDHRHGVVVDVLGFAVDAVGGEVEPLAGEVDLEAVGQVSAVAELHAEGGVAGVHEREVGGEVGLGARSAAGRWRARRRRGPWRGRWRGFRSRPRSRSRRSSACPGSLRRTCW